METGKIGPTSKWLIGGFSGLALTVQGWAVDRYSIEAPVTMTVGSLGSVLKVIPMSERGVDNVLHEIEFVNLPTGVEIIPVDPSRGMAVSGPTHFLVRVSETVQPGPLSPICLKKGDPRVQGSTVITLENPVARFALLALPRSVEQPQLLQLQIVALDARGGVVPSYAGDLLFQSSSGRIEIDSSLGIKFEKGVAVAPLFFQGAVPVGRVRVTVEERVPGPGRTVPAQGETLVKMKAIVK